MSLPKFSRAFTLIELLVVISIISLLSSVVLASLNAARDRARMAAAFQFEGSLYRTVGASAGGFWRLDEGSGLSVSDASGNGFSGTLSGPPTFSTDTPTGKGYSLNFNGTTAYVDLNPGSSVDLADITDSSTGGYTMASWFKATDIPLSANDGYIVMRSGFHSGLFVKKSDGTFGGVFWFSDNTGSTMNTNISVTDGKWHYGALSVNDSTKQATLYLDGRQVAQASYSKTLREYLSGSYRLGGSSGYLYYGLIDNPVIFGQPFR